MLKKKPVVPRYRPLIDVGYKYNYWNVLSFVTAYGLGITKSVITYLSNLLDQISNVDIQYVACPQIMSKFFVSVNEIYYHKKPRQ